MREYLRLFDKNRDWLEKKINSGIEENRKGLFHLMFLDEKEQPLNGAEIEIEQINHDFNFGSNIFMLDEFKDERDNEIYRKEFKSIFNLAVAPFYWQDMEIKKGEFRFEKDAEKVLRRPAPGLVIDYCKENNLRCKGHVLVWHNPSIGLPKWVPINREERFSYIKRYVKEVAKRFPDDMKYWDVINEMLYHRKATQLNFRDDYVEESFKYAAKHFETGDMFINEGTDLSWKDFDGSMSYYFLLIENLLLKGCQIDGIGLQYHMKKDRKTLLEQSGIFFNPEHLFNVLDFYGKFNKKIHISEITIPTFSDSKEDEALQAEIVKELYRLWFSHKAVDGIVWWNYVDQTAHRNENVFNSGLLRKDLSRKPSYEILDQLINKEWKTKLKPVLDENSECVFKGFYGQYKVTVTQDGKKMEKIVELKKGELNRLKFVGDNDVTGVKQNDYTYSMA